MPKPLEFASPVPIVGQAITVHGGDVTAMVTCKCRPDNAPFVIRGFDLMVVCNHCRHRYVIVAAEFDRRKGHGSPIVTVADMGPMGPKESLQ
jgi:hypothetical protein